MAGQTSRDPVRPPGTARRPAQAGRGLATAVVRFLPLVWALLRRRDVGRLTKGVPLLGLLYVLVPVDAVPDVLLLLGQTDDGAVGLGSLLAFFRLVPRQTVLSALDNMGVDNRVARGALLAVHDAPRLILLAAVGLVLFLLLLVVVALVVLL